MPTRYHDRLLHTHSIQHTNIFCTIMSVRVSDSGKAVKCARKYCAKIPYRNLHNYTLAHSTCHHALLHSHTIQHTKKNLRPPITCPRKYCTRQNHHNLKNYTHKIFTSHLTLLHMTNFPHQNESIKIYIPSNWITFTPGRIINKPIQI